MQKERTNIVYSKEVIEFTTVAVEYCIFLEKFENDIKLGDFADRLSKILPLLYLKAQYLPHLEDNDDYGFLEMPVSEEDYNFILHRCSSVLGVKNDYLEVFDVNMDYSDTPVIAHVSENLSDIYQDLRNFAAVFERGVEQHMEEALFTCIENFKEYWGQTLTNVLRAIHSIKYSTVNEDADIVDEEPNYDEEEW